MVKVFSVVVAVAVMFMANVVMAEGVTDLFDKLPEVKQGIALDFSNGEEMLTTTSCDVVVYKKIASLGAGLAYDLNGLTVPIGTASYKIGSLADLGFEYPLAKFVAPEVGVFLGRDIDKEGDWKYGVQCSIISVKF